MILTAMLIVATGIGLDIIYPQHFGKILMWMVVLGGILGVLGFTIWAWADIFATAGPVVGMLMVIAVILISK